MASANVANTYVVPTGTTVSPYYDDFNESKNFHRILFRPGYPVQARELTQLQTIMQNQIERFGRHIFENGSPVIGGDIYLPDKRYDVVMLNPDYNGTSIDVNSFKGKTIVLNNNGSDDTSIKFKVIEVTEATDTIGPALYGSFLSSTIFDVEKNIKVLGEDIFAITGSNSSYTTSRMAFLRDSIFFFDGYFIKVPKQSLPLGLTEEDNYSSYRIGLEVYDYIITEESDSSLLDPALEASNYQAPGAGRYSINLVLSKRTIGSEDDSKFIELARIEGGVITKQIKFPVYSEIEEVLARRTYDESGNYTVTPFVLNFQNGSTSDINLYGRLSPGKAYIYGYEFETIAPTTILIPKERTTKTVTSYDLNMNYGNYVIVDGLEGVFDTSTMETYDIHCVPYANIDFTSNTTYQQTKIGTGRIRDLEFYSGDVDVDARRYEFYLFDTNYKTIRSNINASTANTITLYNSSTLLTSSNNSYNGAVIRILSGINAGNTYSITNYNGATKTFTFAPEFFELSTNASNVSIEFDFAEAESFAITKKYTPGATSNANCNITTLNKTGGVATGSAYVFEPSLNTLLFELPDTYIANGITNMSYVYRKKYNGINFGSGVSDPIAAGVNEDFEGATTTSNTSITVMDNFLVICTDKKTSARSNGDIIKVTSTVTSSDPETVTLSTSNTNPNDSFVATVFAKMQFDLGVQKKLKSFVQANTESLSSETASVISTPSSTGSTARVYVNAGQTVIINPTRKVGVAESIYFSDVIGISAIYDLNGDPVPTAGTLLTDYNDVTERFEFNNGQRDTHYDHATIKLKPNWQACKGPLVVCCYYYSHTTVSQGGGFFIVDSYPSLNSSIINNGVDIGDGYSIIPQHRRTDGRVVELRDCIDFRPARENGSKNFPNYTLNGILIPVPTTDFEIGSYSYYLGRKDLIVLGSDRAIRLVNGIPAKSPSEPPVPNRSMVLYTLIIPPYTEYATDVKVKYIDNRRYTMRDIGKIDKRVENLEYYVSLNLLEKKAVDMSITDVNGLERTKYGIFADSFTGHSLGNSGLEDYQCAMEFKEGYLQCQSNTTAITLSANTGLSTGVTILSDRTLLDYTESVFMQQPLATKFTQLADTLYATYIGNIITLPEADNWKSINTDPTIIVTDKDTVEYTTVKVYQSVVNSQER